MELITKIAVVVLAVLAVVCLIGARQTTSLEHETRLRLQAIQLTAIIIFLLLLR